MLRYGGHAMAVGLTLAADALTRFEACLNAAVLDMTGGLDARIRIDTDGPLSPAEMTFENACFTARGQPWGKGFPEPQFEGEFDILRRDTVKEEHLRLQLRHADGADRRYKAMLFFHRKFDLSAVRRRCRIVFGLDTDEFQGRQSCTLIVHHIEPA